MNSQYSAGLGGAASGAATGSAFGVPGAVIGGVIGGVSGFLSGGGEDEAKELGKLQAEAIRRAARENKRTRKAQMRQQVGATTAGIYASNVQMSGSSEHYRDTMEREYRRSIDREFMLANERADIAQQGGQIAAESIERAGYGQLLGGAMQLGTAAAAGAFTKSPPAPNLKPSTTGNTAADYMSYIGAT